MFWPARLCWLSQLAVSWCLLLCSASSQPPPANSGLYASYVAIQLLDCAVSTFTVHWYTRIASIQVHGLPPHTHTHRQTAFWPVYMNSSASWAINNLYNAVLYQKGLVLKGESVADEELKKVRVKWMFFDWYIRKLVVMRQRKWDIAAVAS